MHRSYGLQHFRHKRPTFAFTGESGYTLGSSQRIAHNGTHGETGAFRTGPLSLPSERSARSQTSPGRVSERQTLPLLGLGRGHSRRTQRACGAALGLCAAQYRRRSGPPGLRCGVCALVMLLFFHSARRAFHTCKRGCGITTLGVLRVLLKRWAAACQKGSFAVF